jgi:hypothetical protein
LFGDLVGRQGRATGDLDQPKLEAGLAGRRAVGPPDQLGADDRVVRGEVEVEVVGAVEVGEGGDDRLGLGRLGQARAQGHEVIAGGVGEGVEHHALADRLDHPVGLALIFKLITQPA